MRFRMLKTLLFMSGLCGLVGCSAPQQMGPDHFNVFNRTQVDYTKAAMANVALGLHYLQQGQIVRAKSKMMKAQTLAPHLPEVHCAYALYLEKVGENSLAHLAYQKAIHLDPHSGDTRHGYGVFLYNQREFEKAEREFLQALSDPDYMNMAQSLENAALCALQLSDEPKAKRYLDKAARYHSSSSSAS